MPHRLKIGLIINPVAGLGGRVALKGSDGVSIQQQALQLGAQPEAEKRTRQTLDVLKSASDEISFITASGIMGGDLLEAMSFQYEICHTLINNEFSTAEDTIKAALSMQQAGVDIILFSGGDGTARNILQAVGEQQPCLGIPAGCKIYSAVFSITPEAAGVLVVKLISGELVEMKVSPVLDINETAFREGYVDTKIFGEMLVPTQGSLVQGVKTSGVESESMEQQEIAAWIVENLVADTLYLIASGSSCKVIKDEIGIAGTLLGVDAIFDGKLLLSDASEQQLLDLMTEYQDFPVKLVLTIIGGQGILLGRGNHQICHKVMQQLALDDLIIVASKRKISALDGKALAVDTGDPTLNKRLAGYVPITIGYDSTILYPIGNCV